MRKSRRREAADLVGLATGEDTRYCVLCEAVMLFEEVSEGASAEWVCVNCGSAVFVDPPAQAQPMWG
jgi:hypothetical protein